MHLSGLIKHRWWFGAALAVLAWAPPAPAATTMVAQHSFKCVDVPYAATSAGLGLQQWTCNGLDFVVQHDKGTDLIVPASPNLDAYVVLDNEVRRNVTSLVRLNATMLRATSTAVSRGPTARSPWTTACGPASTAWGRT